jgi:ribosomal protein S18 acetylase RimI-like enzyme
MIDRHIGFGACMPQDCASLAALGKAVWNEWANGSPLIRQLIDIGHPVFVARAQSGEVIGYATGLPEADRSTGYILSITVHPDYRHMGIGRHLVGLVIQALRDRGIVSINTTVSKDNNHSKQLFTALGFREAKEMRDYYDSGDTYLKYHISFE